MNTQNKTWYQKIDWVNSLFLIITPLLAIILSVYFLYTHGFSWSMFTLFWIFYFATGLSIAGGYHRLFSHRAYDAHPIIQLFYLCFAAATFENSALKWCSDHRIHHRYVDKDQDPYNIGRGFFYAHMGWIMIKEENESPLPHDLTSNPYVMWQHKYYIPIAITFGFILPTLVGYFLGNALGGFIFGGVLRLVIVHHCTFFINSLCHVWGHRTYSEGNTSRDNYILALFTYGEGYHNFHHRFQADYRNGVRWYHYDPTKWMINAFAALKLAARLRRTPEEEILKAKMSVTEYKLIHENKKGIFDSTALEHKLIQMRHKVEATQKRFKQAQQEFSAYKQDLRDKSKLKIEKMRLDIELAKLEFQASYEEWKIYTKSLRRQFKTA